MKDLAKKTIITGILKWLPLGEHLVNPLSRDQLVVIRRKKIFGDTVITDVYLDKDLIEKIQRVIEVDDGNLLRNYMEKVEDFVVMLAEGYENHSRRVWHLTEEVLED
jgi:hypothetical protein